MRIFISFRIFDTLVSRALNVFFGFKVLLSINATIFTKGYGQSVRTSIYNDILFIINYGLRKITDFITD